MSYLHIPQRLEGESFSAYRTRRAASPAINKANRIIGQGGTSSRQQFRDSMRKSGTMGKRTRAYVALCAAWAQKRITKAKLRDEHSYRGYYSDLAFERAPEKVKASDLLATCRNAMGKVYEGYKGGDYIMGELTPIWVAEYGRCGVKLMAIRDDGTLDTVQDDL